MSADRLTGGEAKKAAYCVCTQIHKFPPQKRRCSFVLSDRKQEITGRFLRWGVCFCFPKKKSNRMLSFRESFIFFSVCPKIEIFNKPVSGQYPYVAEIYETEKFKWSDEVLGVELVSKLSKFLQKELIVTVINAVDDTQELDIQALPNGEFFYGELENGTFNRWPHR